jgi:hypothetical protein
VRGRPLLIPSAEDQMMLQQAGGMSDQQMLAVNQLMIKFTGFSIHLKKKLYQLWCRMKCVIMESLK